MKFFITNLNESNNSDKVFFVGEEIKKLSMEILIGEQSEVVEFRKNNKKRLISVFMEKIKENGFDIYTRNSNKNVVSKDKLTHYKQQICHCHEIGSLDLVIVDLLFWKVYTPGKRFPEIVLVQVNIDNEWVNYYITYKNLNSGDLIKRILNISHLVYSHVKNILIELKNNCILKLKDTGDILEIQDSDISLDIISKYQKIDNKSVYLKKLLNSFER